MNKRGLGKGLGALLGEELESNAPHSGVLELDVNLVDRYTRQPRKIFDEEKLKELAESILTHGIVQPIIVKETAGRYTIIAGERRYRAARLAGFTKIPAIIKELNDRELMEISLVENLQREDLNPLEEAEAIRLLMEEYTLTQEKVAERISRSRSAVANTLRLLSLPDEVKQHLYQNRLTSDHARCLAGLQSAPLQRKLAEEIIRRELSVRETEKLIQSLNRPAQPKPPARKAPAEIAEAEGAMTRALGTKVKITGDLKRGRIVIDYYNAAQMESLYDLLVFKER